MYAGLVQLIAIDAAFLSFSCALISGGLVCLVILLQLVSAICSCLLYAGLVQLVGIDVAFLSFSCVLYAGLVHSFHFLVPLSLED
jgi:hypothetical protein